MVNHPKHLPAEERRAATVEAVLALAAAQNPDGITTAAIAGRMNLSQGALFRHFPNKEAIWLAVMEWVAGALLARLDRAAKDITSPFAALEAMFMTHIDFVALHPGVPRILFSELQHPLETPAKRTVRSLSKQYGERLRRLIESGKSQGEMAADLDPGTAVTMFIGIIQGLVMQSLIAGDIQRLRRDAPGAFALYRRALGRSL
jgi:AcrR family transcriptional regulator